jgi:hypothetical protein
MEGLDYARVQLRHALECVAVGNEPAQARLQKAWTQYVQMLWERKCLPDDLNERFKQLWANHTEKTDDPRTTQLRELPENQLTSAISELIGLAIDTMRRQP